jgi:regulator of extracellular matrix RemA (YlzA/DUF370 family)
MLKESLGIAKMEEKAKEGLRKILCTVGRRTRRRCIGVRIVIVDSNHILNPAVGDVEVNSILKRPLARWCDGVSRSVNVVGSWVKKFAVT